MITKPDSTKMAFLLALQDLNTTLSTQEKENLQEVVKQLNIQPKAWKSHIEELLLKIVTDNNELNQSYQFYKSQLDNLEEIPQDLLPTQTEVTKLYDLDKTSLIARGFKPTSQATDYESQLNNVVVIVGSSEKPEETIKQATFLDKWKGFLSQSHPN